MKTRTALFSVIVFAVVFLPAALVFLLYHPTRDELYDSLRLSPGIGSKSVGVSAQHSLPDVLDLELRGGSDTGLILGRYIYSNTAVLDLSDGDLDTRIVINGRVVGRIDTTGIQITAPACVSFHGGPWMQMFGPVPGGCK